MPKQLVPKRLMPNHLMPKLLMPQVANANHLMPNQQMPKHPTHHREHKDVVGQLKVALLGAVLPLLQLADLWGMGSRRGA